jgi:collagenase-like PrtC family protease
MEFVIATNFDDHLLEQVKNTPVTTFFGGFPVSLTGGGRPPYILPDVSEEKFRSHLEKIHAMGRKFLVTLNSNDLGLKEYSPSFLAEFMKEAQRLIDLGVDGFIMAIPILIEALHREYPDVHISASTFARISTVGQAEYFRDMGAEVIILEEANKNFRLIKGLVAAGMNVEILANQTCIKDCPFRAQHLQNSSLGSQPGNAKFWFEAPIMECGVELSQDPGKLINSIAVRPEDLELYESVGVHRFKLSGRNRPTDWLVRTTQAYANRHWDGNLLDILSYVQFKGPMSAVSRIAQENALPVVNRFKEALDPLAGVYIDNKAYPAGFLRRVANTDCENMSCKACGYCPGVAEKVVKVNGKPLADYQPVKDLPPVATLLPYLGASGDSAHRREENLLKTEAPCTP